MRYDIVEVAVAAIFACALAGAVGWQLGQVAACLWDPTCLQDQR